MSFLCDVFDIVAQNVVFIFNKSIVYLANRGIQYQSIFCQTLQIRKKDPVGKLKILLRKIDTLTQQRRSLFIVRRGERKQ